MLCFCGEAWNLGWRTASLRNFLVQTLPVIAIAGNTQHHAIISCERLFRMFCVQWFLFMLSLTWHWTSLLCYEHMYWGTGKLTEVTQRMREKARIGREKAGSWASSSITILISSSRNHNHNFQLLKRQDWLSTKWKNKTQLRIFALQSNNRSFSLNPTVILFKSKRINWADTLTSFTSRHALQELWTHVFSFARSIHCSLTAWLYLVNSFIWGW